MKKILIIGATSAIAEATARFWAMEGGRFHLVARNVDRLKVVAADLLVRGAESVSIDLFEAIDFNSHPAVIEKAFAELGFIDVALIAHGYLGDQMAAESEFGEARAILEINGISVVSMLTHLANRFEAQGRGAIVVVGSVAGERGRGSNYVYGAAKGMVSVFLQGLRNRLYRSGVRVLTVKPGPVDTPMTAGMEKGLLWTTPETVAKAICDAVERDADVVYVPRHWGWFMTVARAVPEKIFTRLRL